MPAPRDPVTGTPSTPAPHDSTPLNQRDPEDIVHDIRRTRADISETLNEIESRVSPNHLKEQVKDTIHETIDEVQDRLDPRHLIHNARRTMIDTIRENPVPSIIAGLSIGYLIFNPSDERERRVRGYGGTQGSADRYGSYGRRYDRYEPATAPATYGAYQGRSENTYTQQTPGTRADDSRGTLDSAKERASHLADQTQEHMHQWADDASEQVHRAKSGLESFVHDNPLAAGVIAIGMGALLGGMFPPTPQENALMGRASDRITDRMQEAASTTLSQAREAAENVAHEAKSATQDEKDSLKSSAQNVADRVKDTARDEARDLKDTVRQEASSVKDTAQNEGQKTRPTVAST